MSSGLTFILGGAASGKSEFAEILARTSGKPLHYLATSQPFDHEMRQKVDIHRARRGTDWTTHEAPLELAPVLEALPTGAICLLDCATFWLSNHMMAESDLDAAQSRLLRALSDCPAAVIVVSNEVGQGIVPADALSRRFREAQGRLNIALAARADLVVQVVAGLPNVLKGKLP
ncbi:bifunctional adenosylcobinamide kinase/adenosylcobinamide-phosphate guanylyltransferase [Antarcticimicrobium sediminis]|uniref:Bifunctional adenosylcobalamin biosynthesis protein n=1 Tax=Antarcticimicrobium sediminis TaxID=2546227 RepID=A0A4R5EXN7_9RHOB|nr:bifunctional adenosylcobinamide kinase/adenosylcobinamide-phosphate guanylyltransferase [Antarcticimicrobium sediminis]TDE39590.1 bifunctional adenosylcobinamide kinase/adenosylcobinamide-phosphate guanylyltransferase [Antarcticimicrobium sediminis]